MSVYTLDSGGQLWKLDVDTSGLISTTSVASGNPTISTTAGAGTLLVSDFIKGAMRLIGAIAAEETPTAAELENGIQALNDLLDSWNTERYVIYDIAPQTLDLVAGVASYTIGEGGALDIPRPAKIEKIVLRNNTDPSNPIDYPLHSYTLEEWACISNKSFGDSYPCGYYDDRNYPTRSVTFYPVPQANLQAIVYGWYGLAKVTSGADTIALPPGYARALRFNLAVDLYPEYASPGGIDPLIVATARQSKANMKALNDLPTIIKPDNGVFGSAESFCWSISDFMRNGY